MSKSREVKNDFYFLKTPDGRPTNDSSKKVTWIPDDPESEIVTCWVCRKYPSECDQDNEVTKGTKKYHRNYTNRHVTGLNNKHQKCIEIYLRECFPKHLTRLQEMQINLNLKCKEEILRLINTSYYIVLSNIAFNKYPGICDLQEFNNIQLGNNHRTDKYCRLLVNTIATEMESELSSLIDKKIFISVFSDGSTDAGVIEQENLLSFIR